MFDYRSVLQESGGKSDSGINLLSVALALAAAHHEGISVDRYFNHVSKMASEAGARYIALLNAGAKDDAGVRLAALKYVLGEQEQYTGDTEHYNDLQNADLMRVIDRRKGMPIALCLLYIHVGRENGWEVDGLNFPGHFLCRMQFGAERIIFDPFDGCKMMEAPDLRALLKKSQGEKAELSADYYSPCSNREILLRLQNNVKLRLIEAEDYQAALENVELMRLFAPDDYRLLFDAGVLYARTGKPEMARDVLETYVGRVPDGRNKRDALALLASIMD